jgi:hypothetical protein
VGSGLRAGIPTCPRPDHLGSHVTLDGVHGAPGRQRQRYRCYFSSGRFHRFTGMLTREVVADGVCEECENRIARHQGPAHPRHYMDPVRAQAAALVAVGKGESYAAAARRTRSIHSRMPTAADDGGQLVANWVEVFGPGILATHAEHSWPETLLLDSTDFKVSDPETGRLMVAFNLLAAYGYPAVGRGRLWALMASPTATRHDWLHLLSGVPGDGPRKVIADKAGATAAAVRLRWPTPHKPFFARCEWHLRDNALEIMATYQLTGDANPEMAVLNTAFQSEAGWLAFRAMAAPYPNLDNWGRAQHDQLQAQARVRNQLPAHYSVAAIEPAISKLRAMLESRRFYLRNAARTNLLVGLMRLHLNGVADERCYATVIRQTIESSSGRTARQLAITDPRGRPSLRPVFSGRHLGITAHSSH